VLQVGYVLNAMVEVTGGGCLGGTFGDMFDCQGSRKEGSWRVHCTDHT